MMQQEKEKDVASATSGNQGKLPKPELIGGLDLSDYWANGTSLYRKYQDRFLERFGPELSGDVKELGSERKYDHQRFFPNANSYSLTNIGRDFDEYQDVTNLTYPDSSIDGFVCVSVLEHVPNISQAFSEIHRTLRPGGKLLVAIPFLIPFHDTADYWRLSLTAWEREMSGYEVRGFFALGGTISTCSFLLQRPRWNRKGRYRVTKLAGWLLGKCLRRFDSVDAPLGYAAYAVKK